MAFEPFDLGRVYQTAESIRGMRRQEKTDALRDQYLMSNIQGAQQQLTLQKQEADAETQARQARSHYLAAQAVENAADPIAAAHEFAPEMIAAFEQQHGPGTFEKLPPDAVKKIAGMGKEKSAAAAGINLQPDAELLARQKFEGERQKAAFAQQEKLARQEHGYRLGEIGAANSAKPGRSFRALTPEEVAQAGLPPGTSAQLDESTGKIDVLSKKETASGNVTEGERKAAALGTRLESALQSLNAIETVAPGASRPGLIERGLEGIGMETAANAVRSSDRQQADAAQLDALDAALTLATGAAYTKEQLANLRKSYFPQIGDSAENVAAKRKRFETIVQTARIASGRAEPSIDKAVGARGASEATKTISFNDLPP